MLKNLRHLFPARKFNFLASLQQDYSIVQYPHLRRSHTVNKNSDDTELWNSESFGKYLEEIRKEFDEECQKKDSSNASRWRHLSQMCAVIERRETLLENLETLRKIARDEKDEEFKELAEEEEAELKETLREIHSDLLEAIVAGNEGDDYKSFILEVTAGVGGKEAMLFARDLYTMYTNYCNFRGWFTEVLEEDHMEIGGIRHASLCITGQDAFQTLKREGGVHRVQRIPVTEKSGRVHTSTVTVAIIPRPDDISIVLNSSDLRIETKRATGAGGQHVNTTDSAVRITHLPTGVSVECQTDRSQIKNRELAMKKLQARLYEAEIEAQIASTVSTRKSQVGTSMRNEKIRTYNFNQDRVTDHRIEDGTVHNLKGILEGREILDDFIGNIRVKSKEKQVKEFLSSLRENPKK
ncbi:peptide chain release factor 1-like, mitochondrial [Lutzomyia longipalpis]|uniref:peptide chain release factor 1-like, mitochondrial n=1 Tax=Lutzomyia longipalpis TaxID=7200 RepID=UPI002483E541|nr:peptide chain release factor 1-like, mitochondrial [Lutzomyia longipalpis]